MNRETIERLISSGAIALGMTRAALFLLLGKPDDYGGTSNKYKDPSIYKYGVVQMVFRPCRNLKDSEHDGLEYVYIDDDGDQIPEPVFLLR